MGKIEDNYFNEVFNTDQPKNKDESLEERFEKERLDWSSKIDFMSKKLQKVFELNDLMTIVYTERQRLVEYYYYLLSLLSKVNRQYRKEYAIKYEYYSFGQQIRFPNETSKNNKILSELDEIIRKKDALEIQVKFIDSTIKSIDHVIWAISKRIELENIKYKIQ